MAWAAAVAGTPPRPGQGFGSAGPPPQVSSPAMGAADDGNREKWLSSDPKRTDDPQRERVYRAQSATIRRGQPRDLQTVEDVRRLIEAAVRDLGVRLSGRGPAPPALRIRRPAECDPDGRVIFIEAADEHGAIHSLLAFHELAHVLPRPPTSHTAQFSLAPSLTSSTDTGPGTRPTLRMQFLRRAVRAAPGPGSGRDPPPSSI